MNTVILLGAPGSGKGTLAEKLTSDKICHLSSGDLLRSAIKQQTIAGKQAQVFIEKGNLVPDELIEQMIDDFVNEHKTLETLLLDGFPRTVKQADKLNDILKKHNAVLKCALLLDVSDDVVLERITGRLVCPKCKAGYHKTALPPKIDGVCDGCGTKLETRVDDTPETVKHRLDVYKKQTLPLVDYYKEAGVLRAIDGNSDDLAGKVNCAMREIQ